MSEPIRRFYKDVTVAELPEGVVVLLDGRGVKTPGRLRLMAPCRAVAELIAAEWAAQGETIFPHEMPMTRLANVAIDRAPLARAELAASIGLYVETDLVCHRAERPEALVTRQSAVWDPIADWARAELGARFAVVVGVVPAGSDAPGVEAVTARAAALDDFRLIGLAHAVGQTGSAAVGFALMQGWLDAEPAFQAAALDDLYQVEVWGEDLEAIARLERLRRELSALELWFAALNAQQG